MATSCQAASPSATSGHCGSHSDTYDRAVGEALIRCIDVGETCRTEEVPHLIGFDHREPVMFGSVVRTELFMIRMRRVREQLVDEDDSPAREQDACNLGHAALDVDPVMHRVDREDRIDGSVVGRKPLCCPIKDVQVGAIPAEHASQLERPTHEGRRLDGQHMCTRPRCAHRARAHAGADIDDSFARLWVDEIDDGIVDRRSPHPGQMTQIPKRTLDPLIIVVALLIVLVIVLVTWFSLVMFVRHMTIVSASRSRWRRSTL
jgi:hypothetical protein